MGITRQWALNQVDITGETGTEHIVKQNEVGKKLMVRIRAKDAPICTDNPSISGTPQEGQTLTCKRGNWLG